MTEEQATGLIGAANNLGGKLITSLPAQFLMLVLLNTAFLGGMLWFLDREQAGRYGLEEKQADSREKLLLPLLNACITQGMEPKR